jgi:ATP-dependent DNA helicase RecQ
MQEDLSKALKKYFGFNRFRSGQLEIIQSISRGENTLAVMPTGGGKSLCYQLPALCLPGLCIVISPLIALMKDQSDALAKNNIPVGVINSALSQEELNETYENIKDGKYKLIYIAPERVESPRFLRVIKETHISFLAVDEAHCISEWGHDFRPAYLSIKKLIEHLNGIPVIALTATATKEVQNDIVNQLGVDNAAKFIRGFDRPNLSYFTELCSNKSERISQIIKKSPQGSTIIYCGSRKKVEKTREELLQYNIKAGFYHAGLDDKYRKQTQDYFFNTKNAVIVATNAFGMGIDKSNVRNVIHTDLTMTLEGYYQEAGRAGRDGEPSECRLLYQPGDRFLQEYFIENTFPPKDEIEKVYNYLFETAQTPIGVRPSAPLLIDEYSIASALQIPYMLVQSILKILERYNIAAKSNRAGSSTIRFGVSPKRVKEYLKNIDFKRADILESLLRYVSAEAFREDIDFDFSNFINKYKLKSKDVNDAFRAFAYSGIVSYSQASQSEGIIFLDSRNEFSNCGINFEEMITRKEFAHSKLNSVEQYVLTKECKRNYILEYFGELDYSNKCGRCSSCLSQFIESPNQAQKIDEKELKIFLQTIYNYDAKFSKSVFVDFFKGARSKAVNAFKLDEDEYFGAFKKKKDIDLQKLFSFAYKNEYIIYGDDQYHKLELSRRGQNYISTFQSVNDSTQEKNNKSTESSDPLLYRKLHALREGLAAKDRVSSRSIISDKLLYKLSGLAPRTKKEFELISGISALFIQKYADYFIDIITKHRTAKPKISIPEHLEDLFYSFRSKDEFSSILKKHKLTAAECSRYFESLVELGADFDYSYYVDSALINKISKMLESNQYVSLREIRKGVEDKFEFYEIRMGLAVSKKK